MEDFNSKYTGKEVENILDSVGGKQDALVSGENIKTINDESIVGKGNITIAGGEDGATFTPSVDSAGNLSWSNDKGLANPPTVNIKGPKGDAGSGGGGSSEKEIVKAQNGIIEVLEPNKIYILTSLNFESPTFEIQSIAEPIGSYAEYCVIIYAEPMFGSSDDLQPSISLPEGLRWPNGSVPDITKLGVYELNVVYSATDFDSSFNAVLTPFQYVD